MPPAQRSDGLSEVLANGVHESGGPNSFIGARNGTERPPGMPSSRTRACGVRFGRKPLLVADTIQQVRKLRKAGKTVPEIMRQTSLSKASVYRALSA